MGCEILDKVDSILKETTKRQEKLKSLSEYLFELESHLALIFAFCPDIIIITNASGKILRVNYIIKKILGYEIEELLNQEKWQLIHPDDIDFSKSLEETFLQTNNFFEAIEKNNKHFTNRWRKKDGTYVKIIWKYAFFDVSSQMLISFGFPEAKTETNSLIPQQIQTEDILHALHNTNAGIIITDYLQHDNPIIFANKTFEDLTGFETEEILGKNCRIFNQRERDQKALETIRQAIKDGKNCEVLLKNFHKNGQPWYNLLVIEPVRKNDVITNYIGISRDVTSYVEAEYIIWDKNSPHGLGKGE